MKPTVLIRNSPLATLTVAAILGCLRLTCLCAGQPVAANLMRMTVHEDEIETSIHWEAVLRCAIENTDPIISSTRCTSIVWTRDQDGGDAGDSADTNSDDVYNNKKSSLLVTESSEAYRIVTDIDHCESQLHVLREEEFSKGLYSCTVACGPETYTTTCPITNFLHQNRSFLCAERVFAAVDVRASATGSPNDSNINKQRQTTASGHATSSSTPQQPFRLGKSSSSDSALTKDTQNPKLTEGTFTSQNHDKRLAVTSSHFADKPGKGGATSAVKNEAAAESIRKEDHGLEGKRGEGRESTVDTNIAVAIGFISGCVAIVTLVGLARWYAKRRLGWKQITFRRGALLHAATANDVEDGRDAGEDCGQLLGDEESGQGQGLQQQSGHPLVPLCRGFGDRNVHGTHFYVSNDDWSRRSRSGSLSLELTADRPLTTPILIQRLERIAQLLGLEEDLPTEHSRTARPASQSRSNCAMPPSRVHQRTSNAEHIDHGHASRGNREVINSSNSNSFTHGVHNYASLPSYEESEAEYTRHLLASESEDSTPNQTSVNCGTQQLQPSSSENLSAQLAVTTNDSAAEQNLVNACAGRISIREDSNNDERSPSSSSVSNSQGPQVHPNSTFDTLPPPYYSCPRLFRRDSAASSATADAPSQSDERSLPLERLETDVGSEEACSIPPSYATSLLEVEGEAAGSSRGPSTRPSHVSVPDRTSIANELIALIVSLERGHLVVTCSYDEDEDDAESYLDDNDSNVDEDGDEASNDDVDGSEDNCPGSETEGSDADNERVNGDDNREISETVVNNSLEEGLPKHLS